MTFAVKGMQKEWKCCAEYPVRVYVRISVYRFYDCQGLLT